MPDEYERDDTSPASNILRELRIMNDREFLMWLHERLVDVHGDNPLMDYMHKLRAIISVIPKQQRTPTGKYNSLDALVDELDKE